MHVKKIALACLDFQFLIKRTSSHFLSALEITVLEISFFKSCFQVVKLKLFLGISQVLLLLTEAKNALPAQGVQQILAVWDKGLKNPQRRNVRPASVSDCQQLSLWQCSLFPD